MQRPSLPIIGDCRRIASIKDATIFVFGDNHLWPGDQPNAADRALKHLLKTLKPRPKIIVCNGDLFDFPVISRHPRTNGYFPNISDELEAGRAYLREIEKVAPDDCVLVATIGNHDERFIRSLAANSPEYLRIFGSRLEDHIPTWGWCWQLVVNKRILITHYWHTGQQNAGLNNLLKSGAEAFISNHLHGGHITSTTDFDGKVRWAVDTGTMADFDISQRKFTHYTRGTPVRWKQGFAVLTIDAQGRLLPPELVQVVQGEAYFRGRIVS
jgi:hypothetical protein